MGLDMYVYRTKDSIPDIDFDFGTPKYPVDSETGVPRPYVTEDDGEMFYWRKHWGLFHWFSNLRVEKGGDIDSDFNYVPVKITAQDINKLELDVLNNEVYRLDDYGDGSPDQWKGYDLDFISKARDELKAGFNLFFFGWY